MKTFKKTNYQLLLFSWLLIASLIFSCNDPVEQECDLACKKFVQCAIAGSGQKLTENELQIGKIQCVQGCTMIQGDVLRCYREAGDTCDGFKNCILQSGAFE